MIRRSLWALGAASVSLALAVLFFALAVLSVILSPLAEFVLWNNTRRARQAMIAIGKQVEAQRSKGPSEEGN